MKAITRDEAVRMIEGTNGRTFGCTFVKRTTGDTREGNFRLGRTVQKNRAGGEAPYNFAEKGLIGAYRMAGDSSESEGQWRTIPIEGIQTVRIDGQEFQVA